MRVLSVLAGATTRTGGPPAFVGGAARELVRLGFEMPVLTTDLALAPHGVLQREQRRAAGDELHPDLAAGELRVFAAREPRRLAFAPDLGRALRDEVLRADLVHIHNLWLYPQFAAFRAAIAAGVPYVVSPHGSLDHHLRETGRGRKAVTTALWQRRMLARAAALHVTTDAELAAVADVAPGVRRFTTPCGVDTALLARPAEGAAFRRAHLDGFAGPVVTFLGRVTAKKGIDILIRSFAHSRAREACRLAIIGPDDEGLLPRLRAVADQLGVTRDVAFVGPLYGEERAQALAATDVWALSSHTENFGIAVIEAMAAGLPVVISPGVNLAADVARAGAGVVADLRPEPFGAALADLLADDDRRARLRVVARTFAARYDWSVVGPRLADAYASVARGD